MSIEYPLNIDEIASRERTDVKSVLPASNPFQIRNSFLNSIIVGTAGRIFDIYNQLQALQSEMFMDTAEGSFLQRWGTYENITRLPASQSEGFVTATGTASTAIPTGTIMQSSDGIQYETTQDETISTVIISVLTITRSGQTATVTTSSNHNYADGMTVATSGANESEYNGSFVIVTTALNSFTFTVSGSPATPATGTIISTATFADVDIKSVTFGSNTNQDRGAQLSFVTPIAGADNNAAVQFEGLEGGEDIENDADFRNRVVGGYQDPASTFNAASIIAKAKEISGVTRVQVENIDPDVGQVTVYFLRDNDDPIIPTGSEVSTVKDHLLTILPAHVDPVDLIVLAPDPVNVDFIFSALSPSTASMQEAIEASLIESFRENSVVGENFLKIAYESAIWQTIDTSSGDRVISFSLVTPAIDIAVLGNQIAIFKSITFL